MALRRPPAEDRVRAALWFVEHGFRAFSVWSADDDGTCRCLAGANCSSPGKHPIAVNGFKDATDDPERIRTFLAAGSAPNYGLVCPDGVFALDVDGPGIATLAELEARLGALPPTLRTKTANGEHLFFRWPAGLPRPIGHLFGFVTRWGSGRDAGYVIGPRSVHPSGVVYEPAPGAVFEIAELPAAWAQEALGPASPLITVTVGAYSLPDRVRATESRYEAIRAYTAHLYNRGFSREEMWLQVRDALAPRFEVPLAEHEVRARFERTTADLPQRLGAPRSAPPEPVDPASFAVPEDRGLAVPSELAKTEYIDDLLRPGRIVVWAAEEGSGKSYAVAGELAVRLAAAAGRFAETWEIVERGRVLVLSEMHADDDYVREETVLASLDLRRDDLRGRYYRLGLMTAAQGRPVLMVPEWRGWAVQWMETNGIVCLVVDTATGATQVDPWGKELQGVYAGLRMMLEAYRALSIVLVVHVRKEREHGADRGLSSVLGEWGRWCDVVVLQENDGSSLERTKITVRKRVRHERRIIATKRGGLLVDVTDTAASTTHVPLDTVVAVIEANPGISYAALAGHLDVSKDTAVRYVKALGDRIDAAPTGPRGSMVLFVTAAPPHGAA